MDDLTKLGEDLDAKVYKGAKYRDPNSKTSRAARSISRQNAKKRSELSDEELIGHDLEHFRSEAVEDPRMYDLLTEWLLNSFAKGEVAFEADKDVTVHFTKSTGAGGQFTNKRETAVVCVHKPTLIQARCEETPRQEENRKRAIFNLKLKLEEHFERWQELLRLNPNLGNEAGLRSMIEKVYGNGR